MTSSAGAGEFVERARERILDHAKDRRRAGLTDKLYAVARSETGILYEGVPFETSMPQFDFCAERHAINEMLYAEPGATLDAILVATPAPDETAPPPTPCGACRHAIAEFGDDATVLCTTFVREDDGWTTFPRVERFTGDELYPDHQGHPSWE
jgi:cytidine deaminase